MIAASPVCLPVKLVAVIVPAEKLPELLVTTVLPVVSELLLFNPSKVSASRPEPVPSTVLILVKTSAAV